MTADAAEKSNCPICDRLVKTKAMRKLFDVPVCKKCRNGFVNRRQIAYILDSIGLSLISYGFGAAIAFLYPPSPGTGPMAGFGEDAMWLVMTWAVFPFFFTFKDGFAGRSPGKWLFGIQAIDRDSLEPIGLGRSFKRNWPTMIPIAPLIIALQMIRGPRWGDKRAKTKVIWMKYRHRVPFDTRGILCLGCGYDLTGNVSGRCPECGLDLPRPAPVARVLSEPVSAAAPATTQG